MKKLLSLIFFVISINAFSQNFQDLIAQCSIEPPAVLQKFPLLNSAIQKSKSNDNYLGRIYYGRFEGLMAIKMSNNDGSIIVDNAYLEKSTPASDALSTWFFLNFLGVIHYQKINSVLNVDLEGLKYKNQFALKKAKEIAENGTCQILSVGLNVIGSDSRISPNPIKKQAAIEVLNSKEYDDYYAYAIQKECHPYPKAKTTQNSTNNNTIQATPATPNTSITSQNETKIESNSSPFTSPKYDIKKAMKEVRLESSDKFDGTKLYISDKLPHWDKLFREDRFFIYARDVNGSIWLNVGVTHQEKTGANGVTIEGNTFVERNNGSHLTITTIEIAADDKHWKLPAPIKFITNNGTPNWFYNMSMPLKDRNALNNNAAFINFIKSMSTANHTIIRRSGVGEALYDFELSSKDKKAIMDILNFIDSRL